MEAPMEFWGVEVKAGKSVEVDPSAPFPGYIHISQVALGEATKKDKAAEPVILHLKVDDKKFVLGTLNREDIPQLSLDIVLDGKSELSHNSKGASIYFTGYKVLTDDANASDFSDSDEEMELLEQENGKPETKTEDAKVANTAKPAAAAGPSSAKQVKIVDPKKDEEEGDIDVSSPDVSGYEDELMSPDEDSDDDSDDESDEEEETPTPAKKVDQGKKRPNESASKTPVSSKKAKNATPEKTDGKKNVHTATPHPKKQGGKTPNSFGKDKSPNSGGKFSNKSGGSKPFNSNKGGRQKK